MSSSLEHILELLDEALKYRPPPPPPPAMTSRRRSENDVTVCSIDFSPAVTQYPPPQQQQQQQQRGSFYDDSLRPKSFLHDEVDEFNRVLAELLHSKQQRSAQPRLTAAMESEEDLACFSSWSEDSKDDLFQMRKRPDDPAFANTAHVVNNDSETLNTVDDSQPEEPTSSEDIRQNSADADDDDDDYVDVLEIVEEVDHQQHLATKDLNVNASHNIFTDDLFNEDDADSGYQSGNSTMIGPRSHVSSHVSTGALGPPCSHLRDRLEGYNVNCRHSGLTMTIAPDSSGEVFQGFIRVHMNLHKPISMAAGVACPRDHDVTMATPGVGDDVTEPFYLPANTSKVIHITSEMTTPSVIQTLLDKFLISDSCQKFALYEKINYERPKTLEERRLNGMLRRLTDDEKPLQLCLRWADDGADSLNRKQFVLQDNVTSEIAWDTFSLPELEAFLRILDREEESYRYQLQLKYAAKKRAVEMRLKQLLPADNNASSA